MDEILKQTEIRNTKQESHTAERIVGVIFGVIEVTLLFRLIFKLLGANPDNGFVQGIYAFTQIFTGVFEGIFSRVGNSGVAAAPVLEPATLIAMVVIAVIAWFVLRLMTPRPANLSERTEFTANGKSL